MAWPFCFWGRGRGLRLLGLGWLVRFLVTPYFYPRGDPGSQLPPFRPTGFVRKVASRAVRLRHGPLAVPGALPITGCGCLCAHPVAPGAGHLAGVGSGRLPLRRPSAPHAHGWPEHAQIAVFAVRATWLDRLRLVLQRLWGKPHPPSAVVGVTGFARPSTASRAEGCGTDSKRLVRWATRPTQAPQGGVLPRSSCSTMPSTSPMSSTSAAPSSCPPGRVQGAGFGVTPAPPRAPPTVLDFTPAGGVPGSRVWWDPGTSPVPAPRFRSAA